MNRPKGKGLRKKLDKGVKGVKTLRRNHTLRSGGGGAKGDKDADGRGSSPASATPPEALPVTYDSTPPAQSTPRLSYVDAMGSDGDGYNSIRELGVPARVPDPVLDSAVRSNYARLPGSIPSPLDPSGGSAGAAVAADSGVRLRPVAPAVSGGSAAGGGGAAAAGTVTGSPGDMVPPIRLGGDQSNVRVVDNSAELVGVMQGSVEKLGRIVDVVDADLPRLAKVLKAEGEWVHQGKGTHQLWRQVGGHVTAGAGNAAVAMIQLSSAGEDGVTGEGDAMETPRGGTSVQEGDARTLAMLDENGTGDAMLDERLASLGSLLGQLAELQSQMLETRQECAALVAAVSKNLGETQKTGALPQARVARNQWQRSKAAMGKAEKRVEKSRESASRPDSSQKDAVALQESMQVLDRARDDFSVAETFASQAQRAAVAATELSFVSNAVLYLQTQRKMHSQALAGIDAILPALESRLETVGGPERLAMVTMQVKYRGGRPSDPASTPGPQAPTSEPLVASDNVPLATRREAFFPDSIDENTDPLLRLHDTSSPVRAVRTMVRVRGDLVDANTELFPRSETILDTRLLFDAGSPSVDSTNMLDLPSPSLLTDTSRDSGEFSSGASELLVAVADRGVQNPSHPAMAPSAASWVGAKVHLSTFDERERNHTKKALPTPTRTRAQIGTRELPKAEEVTPFMPVSVVRGDDTEDFVFAEENDDDDALTLAQAPREGSEDQARGPVPAGTQFRVVFEFTARDDSELSIAVGETITLIESYAHNEWWLGVGTGGRGLFPSNYTEMI